MQAQKIRGATLVALAAGGLASTGSGVAFGAGHDGGATASGGSAVGGSVFQQNTAQTHRHNNNCSHRNGTNPTSLMGGREQTRCVTGDASFNKGSLVKGGGANANGGSAPAGDLVQQNTAQAGRQNNNCANQNQSDTDLTGGEVKVHCADFDGSVNKGSRVRGGGANANGGSSPNALVAQQNTAQEGRQNNNCGDLNFSSPTLTGARTQEHCANLDRSENKGSRVRGGGANANGGSSTGADIAQQNIAQEGRQNNNCASPNVDLPRLTGAQRQEHCANLDGSVNKGSRVKSGGANANGGSTSGSLGQQNIAQEGRQNNNCADDNSHSLGLQGAAEQNHCASHDRSVNHGTLVKGGGANANGGSSRTGSMIQQNTAQEGRQNNNCAQPNFGRTAVTGGLQRAHCVTKDESFSRGTVVKHGGAGANGGSTVGSTVLQQNTAQEGRHNNNCANPNNTTVTLTGASARQHCKTVDSSGEIHTADIGEGAEANGGSSTAQMLQQNTAQEGRHNNNCGNPNSGTVSIAGGRAKGHCLIVDDSFSRHSVVKHGGASANGGSAAAGTVTQQNTAQEGRHNNNCANPNAPTVTMTGASAVARCKIIDHSVHVHTVDSSEGAEADGGSGTATLFQQNTAQEGRANNNCGNPNNTTLTLSGSRTRTQCTVVDESVDVGSRYH